MPEVKVKVVRAKQQKGKHLNDIVEYQEKGED